jgi:FkbM family methyltransferase
MKTEIHNTNFGTFKVFTNCKEISRSIREFKMFHPKVVSWIEENLKDNSTFLDIGANIGIYSVYIAQKYPKTNILSIEAHPEVFSLLEENKHLNKLSNLSVYNKCASNKNDQINFMNPLVDKHRGNYGDNRITETGKYAISSIRADSLDLNKPVSVIKIDVQGFDYYALLGCDKILSLSSPAIIIEWEPEMAKKHQHTLNDLLSYLGSFGYKQKEIYNRDYLFTK